MRTCLILLGVLILTLILAASFDSNVVEQPLRENKFMIDDNKDTLNTDITRVYLVKSSRVFAALKFSNAFQPKLA